MTLGQLLKNRRTELGKSLEQLSAATKIHAKTLAAIENDHYAELPARAFARGFIVAYCKALKLNPEQVMKDYHDFLESKFSERPDRDQGHQGYVFEGKELEQNKRWLVIGATVAGVFAIAVLLVFKPQNHKRKEKHKEFAEEETPALVSDDPDSAIPADMAELKAQMTPAIPLALASPELSPKMSASSPFMNAATVSPTIPPATTPAIPTPSPVAAVLKPMATPTPFKSPAATPKPSPKSSLSPSPSPTPSAEKTEKEDKLNKGDNLAPNEVKRKISFQILDDVWVRYQVDDKPAYLLLVRKGRYLVIKAKEKITFETNNVAALKFRTKRAEYADLNQERFSVEKDGSLQTLETHLGSELPATVPPPPNR